MACFLAVTAEALAVTALKKRAEKVEKSAPPAAALHSEDAAQQNSSARIPWSVKLAWLEKLLWGGAFLLCIEHIWHGEIVPWPPCLTAVSSPGDLLAVLREIVVVGGSMALCVTAVWLTASMAADWLLRRSQGTGQPQQPR